MTSTSGRRDGGGGLQEQWVAGFLPKIGRGVDGVPLARLVVVDYVEDREMQVLAEQLAGGLERSATLLTPVRVLLLRRPAVGALAGQVLEPLLEQPAVCRGRGCYAYANANACVRVSSSGSATRG